MKPIGTVKVLRGEQDTIKAKQKEPFTYIDTTGADISQIKRRVQVKKEIKAPVKKGDKVGVTKYYLGKKEIGSVDVVAAESMEKMSYKSIFEDVIEKTLL